MQLKQKENSSKIPHGKRLDDVFTNKIRAIIAYTARVVATMFASGTLVQTFLSSLGFGSNLIYIHSSLLQAANVLTIILCSEFANKGTVIKRSAFTAIPMVMLFLLCIPLAIRKSASVEAYVMLVVIGILMQMAIGLHTVYEYKIPYQIYRVEEYGMILSVCGIVSSLLSLGAGALISALTLRFPFIDIMTVGFVISAIMMLIVFVATIFQKNLHPNTEPQKDEKAETKNKSSLGVLFKYPAFTRLISANLLRGFTMGIISVLATVALDLGHSEATATSLVSASAVASLVSCGFFALFSKKIKPVTMLAIGSVIVFTLPLLLIRNEIVFVLVYTVITAGRTLIDYAVPSLLIKFIPGDIAGSYHAWRMVLTNLGSFLAATVAAWLPIPLLLALSAIFQMLSCLIYHSVNKKYTA